MPTITCADGCNANLPVVDFDFCAPEVNFSEIQRIFLAKGNAAPFNDWTQPGEWLTRLSQTSQVGDDYIRPLTVIGDKPAGTPIVKEISNGRTKVIGTDHLINYTIDDVSDANYDMMRALECGGVFRMWYETAGGKMYGGNEGISVTITGAHVLPRGKDEIETIAGTITWREKFSPERTTSPIFGTSTGGDTQTFDTVQTFASDEEATSGGITSTAPSTDADLKFEFNIIASPIGTPFTMTLKFAGNPASVLVVSAPAEYLGQAFRFTDISGAAHTGTFASGVVILS